MKYTLKLKWVYKDLTSREATLEADSVKKARFLLLGITAVNERLNDAELEWAILSDNRVVDAGVSFPQSQEGVFKYEIT